MDYLTAAEIANKWKVSSRMAAYYCEAGRIEGAVKKGKTWFIPADAPKPMDRRYSRDIIKAKESQAMRGMQNGAGHRLEEQPWHCAVRCFAAGPLRRGGHFCLDTKE